MEKKYNHTYCKKFIVLFYCIFDELVKKIPRKPNRTFDIFKSDEEIIPYDKSNRYGSCQIPNLLAPHSEQNLEVSLK